MELSIFENGIERHNTEIRQAVQKDGLYVMHEKGYSYSVGMKHVGAPDFILFDQPHDVAEEMFQVLFQAIQLGLVDLNEFNPIQDIFEPKPSVITVSEMEKRQYFYAARTYYGDWNFPVLKITMDFH